MLENLGLFECSVSSNIKNTGEAVRNVMDFFRRAYGPIREDTLFYLKVVLNELILNAIKHGNKEDERKFVRITALASEDGVAHVSVEDDGEGYQCPTEHKKAEDCGCPASMDETGRGLIIVSNLCDKVKLNYKGNRIEVAIKLK